MRKVEVIEMTQEEFENMVKVAYVIKNIKTIYFRRYYPNINGNLVFDRCIKEIIETGSCEYRIEEVLNDLCQKKIIESGNYIIIN